MAIKKYLPFFILGFLLLISVSNVAFAQGIVPRCDAVGAGGLPKCDLCYFLQLGKNLIDKMVQFAILFATVFIIWGGFVIMTAGGSPENVTKGRTAITTAVIGVAITLGAWLIIGTALNIVTDSPSKLPWTQIQCR